MIKVKVDPIKFIDKLFPAKGHQSSLVVEVTKLALNSGEMKFDFEYASVKLTTLTGFQTTILVPGGVPDLMAGKISEANLSIVRARVYQVLRDLSLVKAEIKKTWHAIVSEQAGSHHAVTEGMPLHLAHYLPPQVSVPTAPSSEIALVENIEHFILPPAPFAGKVVSYGGFYYFVSSNSTGDYCLWGINPCLPTTWARLWTETYDYVIHKLHKDAQNHIVKKTFDTEQSVKAFVESIESEKVKPTSEISFEDLVKANYKNGSIPKEEEVEPYIPGIEVATKPIATAKKQKGTQKVMVKDATFIGQRTSGTSQLVVYHTLALGEHVNVAGRLTDSSKLSLRAEKRGGSLSMCPAVIEESMAQAGFKWKDGHWELHCILGSMVVSRVVGATLSTIRENWKAAAFQRSEIENAFAS